MPLFAEVLVYHAEAASGLDAECFDSDTRLRHSDAERQALRERAGKLGAAGLSAHCASLEPVLVDTSLLRKKQDDREAAVAKKNLRTKTAHRLHAYSYRCMACNMQCVPLPTHSKMP